MVLSRRRRRATHAVLVVAGLLTAASGCRRTAPPTGSADAEPTVRITHPVVRQVTEYFLFTGRTAAEPSVDLQSRVTGYLSSIEFRPGDPVQKGALLFKIDPRPYQSQLDIADAQVTLAQARQQLAEADLARARELMRTPGVISQADIDKYVAAEAEAAASVAAAQANAAAAQLNVDFTSIAAPFAGVMGRNYPSVGDLIRQDATMLATIVSVDPIFAYFEVDEQTMLRVGRLINEGKIVSKESGAVIPVEMALADEGEEYLHAGTMDFVNNRISPTTGTLEVRGVFENPLLGDGRTRMFKPGMFVRIRVPAGPPFEAVLVPEAAIGIDQGRKFVLVVNADNVVEQRVVELGPAQPGKMQVVLAPPASSPGGPEAENDADVPDSRTPGLAPTDRIVIGGLQLVRPGTKVQVREVQDAPDRE
jgi:multidrug efflux system membrane fusion protein